MERQREHRELDLIPPPAATNEAACRVRAT